MWTTPIERISVTESVGQSHPTLLTSMHVQPQGIQTLATGGSPVATTLAHDADLSTAVFVVRDSWHPLLSEV